MTSKVSFCTFTIGLLLVWTVVVASTTSTNSNTATSANVKTAAYISTNDIEKKNTRNCKALCEHCGCLGFYCGEECICECNNDNSDTECIATMQSNARKLKIPFEILIQGPTANRFVRTALQFEQNSDRKNIAALPATLTNSDVIGRNKRSTVVIYKPATQNSVDDQSAIKPMKKEASAGRHKRSIGQMDWFNDLANTLTRPAPLGRARKNEQQAHFDDYEKDKRSTNDEVDSTWFTDTANMLLKPAPLFKRQSFAKKDTSDESAPLFKRPNFAKKDASDESDETNAKIFSPRLLKEAMRSIKEAAIEDEFGEALRTKIREGAESLQNRLENTKLSQRNNRQDKNYGSPYPQPYIMRPPFGVPTMAPSAPYPAPETKFSMHWFRPVRFLKRVQHAIN